MKDLVSVIIPVYNVESYLDRCLRSVTMQSYSNIEIILINDGSLDRSGEICQKWSELDKRIIYISMDNHGSGPARNLGIRMASGEYITFLDSDDWWEERYIENMMAYADRADIIICDLNYIDLDQDNKQIVKVSEIRMPSGLPLVPDHDRDLINRCRVFLCGKIFKKSLFLNHNIWQPNLAINDFPIVPLLVAMAGSVCRVAEPLYNYLRGRPGNTVTSFRSLWSFKPALEALQKNFEVYNLSEKYEKALWKLYYSQVRFALRKGIEAVRGGENPEELLKLKNELFDFMDKQWQGWPQVDGKIFRTSGSDKLADIVSRIIFDDALCCAGAGKCDYLLTDGSTSDLDLKNYDALKIINIDAEISMAGESVLWDLADQLLFKL